MTALAYDDPLPSMAGGVGFNGNRPMVHVVWTWPEGVELQAALANLHAGKCWCGRPSRTRTWWACSTKHTELWWKQFEFWDGVRREIIRRDKFTCRMCGHVNSYKDGTPSYDWLEVDHITAWSNGGGFWDRDNLRTLCDTCHKAKTAEDRRKLAIRKKAEKNGQTLEAFT